MIMAALATLAMVALVVVSIIVYGMFLGTAHLIRLLTRTHPVADVRRMIRI